MEIKSKDLSRKEIHIIYPHNFIKFMANKKVMHRVIHIIHNFMKRPVYVKNENLFCLY